MREPTNFAEEFRLYESLFTENNSRTVLTEKKNDANFNNAKRDYEDAVKKVSKGKTLDDIAYDLTSLLHSAISEFKVKSDKQAKKDGTGYGAGLGADTANAKSVMLSYANAIKSIKAAKNFYVARSHVSQIASKLLGEWADESSAYKRIEAYDNILTEIGKIETDKKVKLEALKAYNEAVVRELTNDYKAMKSGGFSALFNYV